MKPARQGTGATRAARTACTALGLAGLGLLAATLGNRPALADDADSAALALPGPEGMRRADPQAVSLLAESSLTHATRRAGGGEDAQRLSVDLRYDAKLAPEWRAVLADRLDLDRSTSTGIAPLNTLKEAYVTWLANDTALFDAGRINGRQGVAFGYNPTDFFRANALRSSDSIDPNSLRDERLGTVMLRGMRLWDGGAVTALLAPRLSAASTDGPFAASWAATNSQTRWLLNYGQRLAAGINAQWLLLGARHEAPQLGFNLEQGFGPATVVFAEAAAGRARTLWAQALGRADPASLQARLATGLTYSLPGTLSLTLEYEYDGAALAARGWSAARTGNAADYGRYREFVAAQQEMATRHDAFAFASWTDVGVRHLDCSAFVRIDLLDHSRLPWVELRYHRAHVDMAVRWEEYRGSATSDYGAATTRQTVQLLLDYYP